ncbi:MAG: pantoate--beta-alanine ligase [Rhodocyclaceae bacterium]|nr:pantoate--beta-alanine ligase [Rhodocyclaceae bacterium]
MRIIHSVAEFRAARAELPSLAFVPTMGNLHSGHIALATQAALHSPHVAASIFVNRLQFGPHEDFDRYPRTLAEDAAKLEEAGASLLFAPDEAEMYPQRQTYHVEPAAEHVSILEGEFRDGHFRGVATVVMKLLNIIQPTHALFGKKDYQQLMVLRNMVREFAMPLEVVAGETVRAEDGLALSSRNGYLTESERAEAPRLYATLQQIRDAVRSGATNFPQLESGAVEGLKASGWAPEYIRICRRSDLQPAHPDDPAPRVVLAAARLGATRLIDNLEI